METKQLMRAREAFGLGEPYECRPFGSGHINDTYLISRGDAYILQRMNRYVFPKMDELMENVVSVTNFLQEKIRKTGGDPKRETLNVIPTKDGQNYYLDEQGDGWRVYRFVERTFSLDAVRNPEDFYASALAFGKFQAMLSDYPAETLHETIPNFHNTQERYRRFLEVVQADPCSRVKEVQAEIEFIREREGLAGALLEQVDAGELPLRVTHNDTKLNNILMDEETGKGLCVIDLDTVMPGLSAYDFGDAIRFGASTAAEDEPDIGRVHFDTDLYTLYKKGFLEGCNGVLTDAEIRALPLGAKVITFEQAIRFLTDYLEGDVYYKIHRPGQNLDRARTQIALAADMEAHWEEMQLLG